MNARHKWSPASILPLFSQSNGGDIHNSEEKKRFSVKSPKLLWSCWASLKPLLCLTCCFPPLFSIIIKKKKPNWTYCVIKWSRYLKINSHISLFFSLFYILNILLSLSHHKYSPYLSCVVQLGWWLKYPETDFESRL